MPPENGQLQPSQGFKDCGAEGEGADDGLCDLGTACRLVQEVENGSLTASKAMNAPSARALISERHDLAPASTNGASVGGATAAADLGPSLTAMSNMVGLPSDLEAGNGEANHVKAGRSSSLNWSRRAPASAQPSSARAFKQAPAHDEHHEAAAAVILTPKQTYDHIVATGVSKTQLTLAKQVTQGVMAGFYISFSFMLCMTVGGQIPAIQHEYPGLYSFILGSVGFPLGLTIIMVVGADLFTSSCMYMITAWIEGRVATYYVIKCWIISWWSNLAGCLIMAQLVVWAEIFAGSKKDFPIYLAHKKTSATFGTTLVRGIICNWLVNLAVWMANSARDLTGKAVGVYLPVSAFVTLGTEHVIANQFELSVAKMLGSGMSIETILRRNWVPATIGNIIGGAFFVGTLYAGTYGTLYDRMWLRATQLYIWAVPRRVRERITALHDAVHDKLYSWVDWDAITAPPAPLPADGHVGRVAPAPGGGAGAGFVHAVSSALADTHKKLATAVVAATRNPPMTPFEHKRTSCNLGSDVV